jgi:hypothetical protein
MNNIYCYSDLYIKTTEMCVEYLATLNVRIVRQT